MKLQKSLPVLEVILVLSLVDSNFPLIFQNFYSESVFLVFLELTLVLIGLLVTLIHRIRETTQSVKFIFMVITFVLVTVRKCLNTQHLIIFLIVPLEKAGLFHI